MYALQTVGSTTSSVKDDTEVLELDDTGNSIVEQIITNSNAVKRSGNLTGNDYISQSHPAILNNERDDVGENHSVGLCFWTIFQAVGLTCVAAIICRSIIFQDGYFDSTSFSDSISITKRQFSNWHYTLTTIGFVYLYANTIFMIKDKNSLPYIMLHTFALAVSALGLYAMYVHKVPGVKPKDHLYSLHAWTGVFAATLFAVQWLSAIVVFIVPCLQKVHLPLGRMFSLYTILVSTIALASGVSEHAVKSLKKEDRPFSIESLVLNGFGMLVMLVLFLITFLVINPNKK